MSSSSAQPTPAQSGNILIDDNRPLTDQERAQVQKLLSDPFSFPDEFKTWLVRFLEMSDLVFPSSAVNGLRAITGLPGPPGTVDFVYNGAYPAGSGYTDGDIVVSDGVLYLCVRPTAGPPAPWPTTPGGGGTGGDLNYVHNQVALATTWVVVHNLAKYVAVEVVNSGDNTVIPDVHYDSLNQVTLTFATPTSGKAYVN